MKLVNFPIMTSNEVISKLKDLYCLYSIIMQQCQCGMIFPTTQKFIKHQSKKKPCIGQGLPSTPVVHTIFPMGSVQELDFFLSMIELPLPDSPIEFYVKHVYCNADHPEFWCVRQHTKKSKYVGILTVDGETTIPITEFVLGVMFYINTVYAHVYRTSDQHRNAVLEYEDFLKTNKYPTIQQTYDYTQYTQRPHDKALLKQISANVLDILINDPFRHKKAKRPLEKTSVRTIEPENTCDDSDGESDDELNKILIGRCTSESESD